MECTLFCNFLLLLSNIYFQTFRSYREMFEEQKAALDQRYRQLLEDAIQDAVFLSSRNNELQEENQSLKQCMYKTYSNIAVFHTR